MPFGPGLIAGIGAVGNLASSLLSNAGAKRRQAEANKTNIEFWNMQNRYNTPTKQMERLKAAGLNPNLIYGSGSANTGVAGSIAPSKTAPYNIKDPIPSSIQSALVNSQVGLNNANIRKINLDSDRVEGGTPGTVSSINSKAILDNIQAVGANAHQTKIIEGILAKAQVAIESGNQAVIQTTLKQGVLDAQKAGFYQGQYQATFIAGVLGIPLNELGKSITIPAIPSPFGGNIYNGGTITYRKLGLLLYGALQAGTLLFKGIPSLINTIIRKK